MYNYSSNKNFYTRQLIPYIKLKAITIMTNAMQINVPIISKYESYVYKI